MKFFKILILFLIINFGALAIGVWLMQNGPRTDWYLSLNKAPWTPPGWAFGFAWSVIMICYSIYMTNLILNLSNPKIKILFTAQFLLNIGWNYAFFNQHHILFGLIIIVLLTAVITIFLYDYRKFLSFKTIFLLPYFLWLCVACSLNLYILLYN